MRGKRLILLAAALVLAAPFAAVAEETYLQKGNLLLSLGVGVGTGWGFTVAGFPGAELVVAKAKIADAVPLDFGIAVKGLVGYSYWGYSYVHLGGGVFGTIHWGPRGMDWSVDFLDPFDFWWGIGIAYVAHLGEYWPGHNLDFATAAGVNYFVNDRFAFTFAANYWGYGGGYVGVLYRLGKGEKLSTIKDINKDVGKDVKGKDGK